MTARRRSTQLQAALDAAAAGMFVFPVVEDGKTPAIKSWQQRATTSRRQIYVWWAGRNCRRNVGIACGPSGLVVIDLDERDGDQPPEEYAGARGGQDVFAMLATAAGVPLPLDTYTVATPSGRHLYFRAPPDHVVRNSAGWLGWRVDTRAAGGYAVAAGSRRGNRIYRVVRHRPVVELPQWLSSALTAPPRRRGSPCAAQPVLLPPRRANAYLRAIIDSEVRGVAEARTGTRHDTLLAAARALGRLVGGQELSEDAARDLLVDAAAGHVGIAGCTAREIEHTVADGIAFGRQLPRRIRLSLHQKQHLPTEPTA